MRMTPTLVIVTAALAGTACSKKAAANKDAQPEVTVEVALAVVGTAETPELLTLTGTIVPDDSSDVAADIAGKVVAVMVDRGQTIKQGDPLIRLDTRNAQLGAREANANLASARAQRKLAEDDCKRAQALFDKGAITKSQYEREQTTCTSALQQVAAAEARTQMITKSISDGIVRAPFAGVVSDRMVSPGEWVAPGVRLVTLVDIDPMRVELTVPESAVPVLALDQRVEIEAVAWPGKVFSATITRKGAEIGRQTRALIAEATIEPGTPLVPGMFVEARLQVGTKLRPVIPETATVKRGQTWRVFVAVDGRLQERVVQLGPPSGPGLRSVLKALEPGEQVVAVADDDKIVDGARIAGQPAPAPAPAPTPAPSPTPPNPNPQPAAVPVEGSAAPR
jgi:membrane fusion protein (multidrug efflux system)